MMLQSKLDVLTTTALQSDTIYGELGSLKKKERTNSILYGPALLLLLAACGGGGGGGGTVSVSSPEPADTDDTPAEDVRVKVGAGPADADGVHRATTDSTKIDIDAEAVQPVGLSAIYKSGDDDADITLEFVDQQNQLSHVFTISNVDDGDLDITVDNKALFIKFGEDTAPHFADDLSGSNNYTSFLDGGSGTDTIYGDEGDDVLFGQDDADTIYGGAGSDKIGGRGGDDTYIGGTGNDTFLTLSTGEGVTIIKDFNQSEGDQVEIGTTSTADTLAALYADLSVTVTNNTDHTGNEQNDTVWRFERGTTGDAGDYLLVFEGFTDDLELNNFVLVAD